MTTVPVAGFDVRGYERVASIQTDFGFALLLHNNSSHFFIISVTDETAAAGTLHEMMPYTAVSYVQALDKVLAFSKRFINEDNEDGCPGCGVVPGDGVTKGCLHPDGCGFWGAEAR